MNAPTPTTAPQRTVAVPEHLYLRLLEWSKLDEWRDVRRENGRLGVQDLEALLACGRKAGVY